MARSEEHEDFGAAARQLEANLAKRQALIQAERERQQVTSRGGATDRDAARDAEARRRAQEEARTVAKRLEDQQRAGVASTEAETRSLTSNTAEIEANTAARRRAAEQARRASVNLSRAFAGAADPQFRPAYALAQASGGDVTQYRLRQQLEGVGSRRAGNLQQAIRAGLAPAPSGVTYGSQTRLQAAQEAEVRASIAKRAANEEYARAERTAAREGTETSAQLALAARQQQAAVDLALNAARLEVKAATQAQAAADEAFTARRAERVAAARQSFTASTVFDPARPGLPAPGETAQGMRERVAQVQTAVPRYYDPVVDEIREQGGRSRVGGPIRAELDRFEEALDGEIVQPVRRAREALNQKPLLALPAAGQTSQGQRGGFAQVRTRQATYYDPYDDDPVRDQIYTDANRPGVRPGSGPPVERPSDRRRGDQSAEQGRYAEASAHYTRAGEEDLARYADTAARTEQILHGMSRAEAEAAREVQRTGAAYGTVDNKLQRHGALTTEFINAAARGETTLRELGNQTLATAGKFAGWTAAASALYAAAGAIHTLGTGAIQSSAGVEQLRRVITNVNADQAQTSFRDYSATYNVDISQASDAVYRFGQVFNDQASATEAARAALLSYKTGEVDVATSTTNLTAIVTGFGLSANQLTNVYDQINQAQNVFGTRIADTEAGLAKAAGTYRNAGGDLSYLLALFVAIQRSTGRSGTEIGTGIARGVNQIRQPSNQAKLEAQGVTVDPGNFQSTFQSALQAARRGGDIQELATGLLGNQYARLITGVLSDQTVLNRALKDTSPEASKGSATRELAHVMAQADEQIKAVGLHIQQLGSALAEAGAFAPLGVALHALNGMLSAVVSLVSAFNRLPDSIQKSVVLLGEALAVITALRRFGAAERLVGSPLNFLASPERRQQVRASRGLRDARTEVYGDVQASARTERQLAVEADIARQRAAAAAAERPNVANLPLDDERRIRTEAHIVEMERQANRASEAVVAQGERTVALKRRAVALDQQLAEVQRLHASEVEAYLATQGIYSPRDLNAPAMGGLDPSDPNYVAPARTDRETRRQTQERVRRQMAGIEEEIEDAAVAEVSSGRRAPRGPAPGTRVGAAATRGLESAGALLASSGVSGGVVGRRIASNAQRTGRLIDRAAAEIRFTTGSIRGMGSSLKEFLAELGPLDFAILGFIGVQYAVDRIHKSLDDATKKLAVSTQRASSRESQNRLNTELAQTARETGGRTTGEYFQSLLELPGAATQDIGHLLGLNDSAYLNPAQRRQEAARAAQRQLDANNEQAAYQARQRARGGPVGNLFKEEVSQNIARDASDVLGGITTLSQYREEVRQRLVEIGHSVNINQKDQKSLRDALGAQQRGVFAQLQPYNFGARFDDATAPELQASIANTTARLQQAGRASQAFDFSELNAEYTRLLDLLRDDSSAEGIQKYYEARAAYFQAIEQSAQHDAELIRLQDHSAGGAVRADRTQESIIRRLPSRFRDRASALRGGRRLLQSRRDTQQQQLQDAQRERDAINDGSDPLTGDGLLGGFSRPNRARTLDRKIARIKANLKKTNDSLRQNLSALHQNQKDLDDAIAERDEELLKLRDSEYEARSQRRQTRLSLRQAQARNANPGDQTASLREALSSARAQTRDALQTYRASGGRNSEEYQKALTDQLNAETDYQEAQRSKSQNLANLRSQIAQARAQGSGDAVTAARATVAAARQAMASARSDEERLQATLDLVNANNALQDAVEDREQAKEEYLASLTEDPVKQGALTEKADTRAVNRAKKGSADYYRALAKRNNDRRSTADAIIQDKESDIEFGLHMETLTNDAAISMYQSLLKTKGITKSARQQILQRIYDLQHEDDGSYDLDLGNLGIPSLYQVARFVKAGQPTASQQAVSDNRIFNVNVTTAAAADAFAANLELTNGTSARSAARSMRVR